MHNFQLSPGNVSQVKIINTFVQFMLPLSLSVKQLFCFWQKPLRPGKTSSAVQCAKETGTSVTCCQTFKQ